MSASFIPHGGCGGVLFVLLVSSYVAEANMEVLSIVYHINDNILPLYEMDCSTNKAPFTDRYMSYRLTISLTGVDTGPELAICLHDCTCLKLPRYELHQTLPTRETCPSPTRLPLIGRSVNI